MAAMVAQWKHNNNNNKGVSDGDGGGGRDGCGDNHIVLG